MHYRVVQLDFTPEIEVLYMLFERYLSIFSMTSIKLHIEYFNFRCKILLDLLVLIARNFLVILTSRLHEKPKLCVIHN